MRELKIAVMADIHLDIAKDGEKRLDEFLRVAKEEGVDLMMHLGDFAYPNDTSKTKCPIDIMPNNVRNAYELPSYVDKEALLDKYNKFGIPAYHTMGNHDFDFLEPADALKMYGIPNGYYSFHMNGWHFIVLDGNYYKNEDGTYSHYDCGDYFYRDLPYLTPPQLAWLEEELKTSDEPALMFSHQALFDYDGGIKDLPEFERIIKDAKARGKEIRMCLSGHMHLDGLDIVDGTYYHNVASLFGFWVGEGHQAQHYCDATEEKFPNLRYNVIYSKPLYSIITMDDEGFSIKGVDGYYVQPGPRKRGITEWKLTPSVKARSHKWIK